MDNRFYQLCSGVIPYGNIDGRGDDYSQKYLTDKNAIEKKQ
jgi:hypothetical protein